MNSTSDRCASSGGPSAVRYGNRAFLALLFFLTSLFVSVKSWGAPPPQGSTDIEGRIRTALALPVTWRVAGHVATLKGEPIAAARITIDIGDVGTQPKRLLQTDLQGRFQSDYELTNAISPKLRVHVNASKDGYQPAAETVEFPSNDKAWVIQVILRNKKEDLVPSLAELVTTLAPKLLTVATQDKEIDTHRKEFQRGAERFVGRHKPLDALPDLQKVTERWPKCAECRTLLGLAYFEAGNWASALREANEAAGLGANPPKDVKLAAPFAVLGAVEEWRGDPAKAKAFFTRALALEPEDPLALQEMGRVLIAQQDWEAAGQPLERALKVSASPEASVLLARVQFELGKSNEAKADMARFREDCKNRTPSPAATFAYAELEQRLKLEARNKIVPLVSEPVPEIQKALPELQTLEAASSQDSLPEILRRTGESVDLFFRTLPNTISEENVSAQRLGKEGKVAYSLDQRFQYLVIVQTAKPSVNVQEYRGDSRGRPIDVENPDGQFMLTIGFTSLSLIFHPAFQPFTKFRYLGTQSLLGRKTAVIAFAQTTENISILERFTVGASSVLILQQGVAWIDAENFQILHMRTDLLKPQTELRLRRQTTEVTYDKVQLKQEAQPLWLPREVAVTVVMRDRSWHNLHRYSDFKLFRVETKDKIAAPKGGPPDTD
jgi:tetratricopeptide (TPR) repeat protein